MQSVLWTEYFKSFCSPSCPQISILFVHFSFCSVMYGVGDSGWVACWAKTPNEPDKSCGWWSQSQMFLLEVRDWPSALTASPAWDDVLWCLRENICMLEVSAMHSQETPHSPCHSALCWNPEIDPLLKKHFRFLGLGVMSDSQQMLTEHLFFARHCSGQPRIK